MDRRLFNKSDLTLVAALLSAAVLIAVIFTLLNRYASFEAHIIIDGRPAEVIELNKDAVFSVPEKPNIVFEVKNGAVAFTASDCPDKICVHTGFIRHGGQFAACLPNRVVLRVVATGKAGGDDLDAVAS